MPKKFGINNSAKSDKWDSFWGYFFVFFLMAVWGMEYFYRANRIIFPCLFLISFLVAGSKKIKVNKDVFKILLPMLCIALIRFFAYGTISYIGSIFFSFMTYYYVVKIIGPDRFWKCLYNWMVFFSITSLFFYFLQVNNLTGGLQNAVADVFRPPFKTDEAIETIAPTFNIIIHNFFIKDYTYSYVRNSGPFWEPGMYGVYLCFALFAKWFGFVKDENKKILSVKNILIIGAVITTFSTMAYLALSVMLFLILFIKTQKKPSYAVLLIALFITSIYAFNTLDFLKDKLDYQTKTAQQTNINLIGDGGSAIHRTQGVYIHLQLLNSDIRYALMGCPPDALDQYTDQNVSAALTTPFFMNGYIGGIYIYILLIAAFWKLTEGHSNRKIVFIALLSIGLIICSSQNVIQRGFFFFLIYLAFCPPKQLTKV